MTESAEAEADGFACLCIYKKYLKPNELLLYEINLMMIIIIIVLTLLSPVRLCVYLV